LWKKQLTDNAPQLFEKSEKDKEKEEARHKEEELYKEIGQLEVENEFLKDDMISPVHRLWYARV
jgi:hypothetical protein